MTMTLLVVCGRVIESNRSGISIGDWLGARPNLVSWFFVDWCLPPKMDGSQLCDALKRTFDSGPDTRIPILLWVGIGSWQEIQVDQVTEIWAHMHDRPWKSRNPKFISFLSTWITDFWRPLIWRKPSSTNRPSIHRPDVSTPGLEMHHSSWVGFDMRLGKTPNHA